MKSLKKMKTAFPIFAFLSFFLTACSPTERVVDNSDYRRAILAASFDSEPSLSVIESGGSVEKNVYYAANGEKLPSKVEKIRRFGGLFYLFCPDSFKIVLIDANSFKKEAVADFSKEKKRPKDACFPNSSTACVIFDGDSTMAIYDIYYKKLAFSIKLSSPPSAIAKAVNRIAVALPNESKALVFDDRDWSIEKEIKIASEPILVEATSEEKTFVVISSGKESDGEKKAPQIIYYDIEKKEIEASQTFDVPGINDAELFPKRLVITNKDWAYVLTNENAVRFDAFRKGPTISILDGEYLSASYFEPRDEINFIASDGEILILSGSKAKEAERFSLRNATAAIRLK